MDMYNKTDYITNILCTAADMQYLVEPEDILSKLVRQFKPAEELDSGDLELVSAAGQLNYQSFMQRFSKMNEL